MAVGLTTRFPGLIIPGLSQRRTDDHGDDSPLQQADEIYDETQNVLRAIRSGSTNSGNYFVAGLVLLFSVIVPFIKAAMLGVILRSKSAGDEVPALPVRAVGQQVGDGRRVCRRRLHRVHGGSTAIDNLDAKSDPGFYYFVAYCLISNLSFQFLHVPHRIQADTCRETTGDQEIPE